MTRFWSVSVAFLLIASSARADAKPEMKAFLDKLLPVLQKHEDMANDILNKSGNTASVK